MNRATLQPTNITLWLEHLLKKWVFLIYKISTIKIFFIFNLFYYHKKPILIMGKVIFLIFDDNKSNVHRIKTRYNQSWNCLTLKIIMEWTTLAKHPPVGYQQSFRYKAEHKKSHINHHEHTNNAAYNVDDGSFQNMNHKFPLMKISWPLVCFIITTWLQKFIIQPKIPLWYPVKSLVLLWSLDDQFIINKRTVSPVIYNLYITGHAIPNCQIDIPCVRIKTQDGDGQRIFVIKK